MAQAGAPFVGRWGEVARLERALAAARAGEPRLVLCGGEAGVGKSRLVDELAARAGAAGVEVRWARAHDDIGSPPFWLWRQLLRDRSGGEPPELAAGTGGGPVVDDRYVVFEAVLARIEAVAADGPLLLVVEDAHWADEPSLLLLRYLVRQLRSGSVLIVVTYRHPAADPDGAWPRVLGDLMGEPLAEALVLTGLEPAEAAGLFEAVAERPVPGSLGAEVHRVTAGNPFYLRELARSYRDGGRLVLPASLIEVVRGRLARLSASASQLLGAAAVLGERFDLPLVASLVGQPVLGLFGGLDEARRVGILAEAGPDGGWCFGHALVRDAVEAQLAPGERAALHRRAAEVLAQRGGAAGAAADIARHHLAAGPAGDPLATLTWTLRAAREAGAALAYEEAGAWYRRALAVGSGGGLDPVERCEVLIEEAAAWRLSTDLEACALAAEQGLDLARRTGRWDLGARAVLEVEPVGRRQWDLRLISWCDEVLGRLAPEPAGAGGAELAAGGGGVAPGGMDAGGEVGRLLARVHARQAEAELYAGLDEAAEASSRRALALADAEADTIAVVAGLRARQVCLSGPEHREERQGLAERMVAAGQVLRQPDVERWGRAWRIDCHWEAGDLGAVEAELARLDVCAGRVGGPMARWQVLITRGALAGARGRYGEALGLAREAFDGIRAAEHPVAFGTFLSLLATVCRHVGWDPVAAHLPDDLPLGLPPGNGEVREEIFAPVGAAQMLLSQGLPEPARQALQGAGPPEAWRPPPYFRVLSWVNGAQLAVALGLLDAVGVFHPRLEAERGRFAVAGAGTASFGGPVDLVLGTSAAALGRLDDAVADLERALAWCRAAGSAGFAVEAGCELATVLSRRDGPGDRMRATRLATEAGAGAVALSMAPWLGRVEGALRLAAGEPPAPPPGPAAGAGPGAGGSAGAGVSAGKLTAREQEVAVLVSRGLTNRQIADELYLSERTAQTHVQHILTKLGFSRRSQIATWVATAGDGAGPA